MVVLKIASDKNIYLSNIRNLAATGNFYPLIKFIENSIPHVSFLFY